MTRKANPYALRLGYNQVWNSFFFSSRESEQSFFLQREKKIRDYFINIGLDISKIRIEHSRDIININIYVVSVDLVLGSNKNRLDEILKALYQIVNEKKIVLKVNIVELKNVFSDAQSIASLISGQLKKRMRSRMIIKGILNNFFKEKEIKGAKIILKGLLDGNDIAQTKKFLWGRISLNTIDNDINVGVDKAVTSRGVIGIKVFLNLGKKKPARRNFK